LNNEADFCPDWTRLRKIKFQVRGVSAVEAA
jgi:hypothetical protein